MTNLKHKINVAAVMLFAPAVLMHELTHAILSKPFGDIHDVSYVPPKVTIEYPAGTNTWAVRAVNLSPTVVGVVAGFFVVPWGFSLSLPIGAYLLGSWAVYTAPSQDDIRPFSS